MAGYAVMVINPRQARDFAEAMGASPRRTAWTLGPEVLCRVRVHHCAPLSFLDVDPQDYALAMKGVYELLDASLAIDLFAWTYRRSVAKYAVVLASMGAPDPMRLRWREALNEALHLVVRQGESATAALLALAIPQDQAVGFGRMLQEELDTLDVHNCARYRLPMGAVEAWVVGGRRR